MKILVVEDEVKTAKFLKKGLNEAGFVVDVAQDGLEGLHLAQEVNFDLMILDVMLPGLDGWQVETYQTIAGHVHDKARLVESLSEELGGFDLIFDDQNFHRGMALNRRKEICLE